MKIYLKKANKQIIDFKIDDNNSHILSAIKQKVTEKENVSADQQEIYINGQLCTDRQLNDEIHAQLKRHHFRVSLKKLSPEQVALRKAVEALPLPSKVKIGQDSVTNELVVSSHHKGDYLQPLSEALKKLGFQCRWSVDGPRMRYELRVDCKKLPAYSADDLLKAYQTERDKIKNHLWYVKDSSAVSDGVIYLIMMVLVVISAIVISLLPMFLPAKFIGLAISEMTLGFAIGDGVFALLGGALLIMAAVCFSLGIGTGKSAIREDMITLEKDPKTKLTYQLEDYTSDENKFAAWFKSIFKLGLSAKKQTMAEDLKTELKTASDLDDVVKRYQDRNIEAVKEESKSSSCVLYQQPAESYGDIFLNSASKDNVIYNIGEFGGILEEVSNIAALKNN